MMKIFLILLIGIAVADSSVNEILAASQQIIAGKSCSSCQSSITNTDFKRHKDTSATLLIFVSSSLSDQSLKELARDAEKIGAQLVFRGLINNSFKDTYQYFKNISINADIDPVKFDDFDVSVVPTFILTETTGKKVDRLQGNVSVADALSQFRDRGDLKDPAHQLLGKLGGVF